MKCPICGTEDVATIDSRKLGDTQRRRRKCINEHKFSTNETVINLEELVVVEREPEPEIEPSPTPSVSCYDKLFNPNQDPKVELDIRVLVSAIVDKALQDAFDLTRKCRKKHREDAILFFQDGRFEDCMSILVEMGADKKTIRDIRKFVKNKQNPVIPIAPLTEIAA